MEANSKKTTLLNILNNKIKDIKIAMFTSVNSYGKPHTRPMTSVEMDYNGTIWFITNIYSQKIYEIRNNDNVSISYCNEGKDIFVCISGKAEVISDRERLEKLWQPNFNPWFQDGINDPFLGLIKVKLNSAEYFDFKKSEMVQLFEKEDINELELQ